MAKVKALTSFDHGAHSFKTGDEGEVSDPTARELAAAKLVTIVESKTPAGSPAAQNPHRPIANAPTNKMAPDASGARAEKK